MAVRDLIPWSRGNRDVASRHNEGGQDPFRWLQTDINRVFEDFWQGINRPMTLFEEFRSVSDLTPRVDVRETDRDVKIEAELPGVKEEDIDISAADGALTISGEKTSERKEEKKNYVLRERSVGRFERVIPLPNGLDLDNAKADFKNGVLNIAIPKAREGQTEGKRIAVNRG
jgi:HSP20 family protein